MGTITAQILVGMSDTWHSGINPIHQLFLSENDRPAWILTQIPLFAESDKEKSERITWIPTVEHMLEDGLLLAALHAVRDPELKQEADRIGKVASSKHLELYTIAGADRDRLYERLREIKSEFNIVLSVFQGSHLMSQLNVLEDIPFKVEVCLSRTAP